MILSCVSPEAPSPSQHLPHLAENLAEEVNEERIGRTKQSRAWNGNGISLMELIVSEAASRLRNIQSHLRKIQRGGGGSIGRRRTGRTTEFWTGTRSQSRERTLRWKFATWRSFFTARLTHCVWVGLSRATATMCLAIHRLCSRSDFLFHSLDEETLSVYSDPIGPPKS